MLYEVITFQGNAFETEVAQTLYFGVKLLLANETKPAVAFEFFQRTASYNFV